MRKKGHLGRRGACGMHSSTDGTRVRYLQLTAGKTRQRGDGRMTGDAFGRAPKGHLLWFNSLFELPY